jgi:hypothetical protein
VIIDLINRVGFKAKSRMSLAKLFKPCHGEFGSLYWDLTVDKPR